MNHFFQLIFGFSTFFSILGLSYYFIHKRLGGNSMHRAWTLSLSSAGSPFCVLSLLASARLMCMVVGSHLNPPGKLASDTTISAC